MKVILSRKGMDSEFGGIPSPIIRSEHGYWKFYSLPIPVENTESTTNSDIKYSDLFLIDDFMVSDFIRDLGLKSREYEFCHLDPDTRESALKIRPKGWMRSFGQVKTAQTHLENHNIGVGDVFLFFGWFKMAEIRNGRFHYIEDKNYPNGFHAIYSYLQIHEIYKPSDGETPSWLAYHPHVKFRNKHEYFKSNNTVYVAGELFDYPERFNKNGSVSFVFSEDLILTKRNQPYRSLWELPIELHPDNGIGLSYNPMNRWTKENGKAILKSAARGQEFVFSDTGKTIENWCVELIKMHSVTD